MNSRLANIRLGMPGLVLFYSYLVAILILAVVVGVALESLHEQNKTLKTTVHRLDEQSSRSCKAIEGAILYWKGERQTVLIALADTDTTPSQHRRMELRLDNLNRVIAAGRTIRCPKGE